MLDAIPIMEGVSEDTLANLANLCWPKRVGSGQMVWLQGEPIETVSLVVEGQLKLIKSEPQGDEYILYMVGAGEVASYEPLLDEPRRTQTAMGTSKGALLLEVPLKAWRRWAAKDEALQINLGEACVQHHMQVVDRILENAATRVAYQLAHLLFRLACVPHVCNDPARSITQRKVGPISRNDLAQLLGVRYETVCRRLKAWQREGYVKWEGDYIHICDGHWLVEMLDEVPPSWKIWGTLDDRNARPACTIRCEECPAFMAIAS